MKKGDKLTRNQLENISDSIQRETNTDMTVSVMFKNKIPVIPDYVQLFQEAIRRIVAGDGMSLITYRVFLFLLGSMEYQNFIGIDIKTLAETLNVSVPSVDRAMKQLKELNIIISIKDTLDKRRNAYMLNPKAAWRGKAKNYIATVKQMKNLQDPGQTSILFPEHKEKSAIQPSSEF